MDIRRLFVVALLGVSLPVAADFSTVTEAYEIPLAELRLPGHVNGTLGFRTCEDCPPQSVSVGSQTRYTFNGRAMTLQRFKISVNSLSGQDVAATVLHHLDSNTITGIKVRPRRSSGVRYRRDRS